MELQEELVFEPFGLKPEDHVGEKTKKYKIVKGENTETLSMNQRTSKAGKSYVDYTLFLQDESGDEFCIKYLFLRDLKSIAEAYTTKYSQWENKYIEASAIQQNLKDGKAIYRWVLTPLLNEAS